MSDRGPILSVLIITFNEAENIRRCLRSVSFADHVLVVDSHSTDDTVALAEAEGVEVILHPWSGYAAQKQFGLDRLTSEWVLWIDADEEVSAALREKIVAAVHADDDTAGYRIPRMVQYLGRWIRHGGWYPDPKLRLFRRERARFDDRLVHEGVEVEGVVRSLDGPLLHYPYRDEHHHADKIETYARLAARQMWVEGRRPGMLDLWLRPAIRFARMWILKFGFLDGRAGFVAARMGARYVRLKYRYARAGEAGEDA